MDTDTLSIQMIQTSQALQVEPITITQFSTGFFFGILFGVLVGILLERIRNGKSYSQNIKTQQIQSHVKDNRQDLQTNAEADSKLDSEILAMKKTILSEISQNKKSGYAKDRLTEYAQNGDLYGVIYALELGASIDEQKKGFSALMYSCQFGRLDVVKYLLKNGAYINQIDIKGRTPLIWASQYGHLEVVKYLLKNGADINLQTVDYKTALDVTISKEVEKYLKSGFSF